MDELIAEYFYEVIARTIPGLLIIVLYWRSEAERLFHAHSDFFLAPVVFIVFVLATAWLVGWLLEGLIIGSIKFAWRVPKLVVRPFSRRPTRDDRDAALRWENEDLNLENEDLRQENEELRRQLGNQPSKARDKDHQREMRRHGYFLGALSVMSRKIAVVSLYSFLSVSLPTWSWVPAFLKPGWLWHAPEPSNYYWSNTCSIVVIASSFFAWFLLHIDIPERKRKAERNAKYSQD